MSEPENTLHSRARQRGPAVPEVRDCWELVVRGIELGWLDGSGVRELLEHLRTQRDFGVEELLFANVGDRLRVSLLDDVYECSPEPMIRELAALVS